MANMIRSTFKKAFMATALVASLGWASGAQAADKVTLILDWLPGGSAAAWYYGIEQKCFADKGIDLTVQRGFGGVDTVTKIAAGVAQFGAADLGAMMIGRIKSGAMVRAVMPLYSVSPLAVGVLASSGIKKLSDLEGKTIAAAPGDSAVLILPVAFAKAGADFSKVKIQTVEMATLTGLLVQGKVDAITTYVMTAMLIDKAAQQAGKSVVTLDFGKALGIYSNSILTSDAVIAAQPDLVKRFREAATCAYVKTNADLPAAVEAMNRAVTGMDVALQIAIAKASLPLILGSPAYGKFGFGWDPAMVATTLAVATKAQGIKTDADPMSFVVGK